MSGSAGSGPEPLVSICVLVFGDHFPLARRVLESIARNCSRNEYELIVGANAVCAQTLQFVTRWHEAGAIDTLIVSPANLGKDPMMRGMYPHVRTGLIWWFDDDSYITAPTALQQWLQAANTAPPSTVLWGAQAWCDHPAAFTDVDAVAFVRSAPWYRGLPPPSWRPGGKGEFDLNGLGTGDGRWFFILGGCFMIRTSAVRTLDWPDPRLFVRGDDVFLGEAVRQHGWDYQNLGSPAIALNTEPSRGVRL